MSWFIQHIVIVYLAGIFLLKSLAMSLICLQFLFNQSFITANFCENTFLLYEDNKHPVGRHDDGIHHRRLQ